MIALGANSDNNRGVYSQIVYTLWQAGLENRAESLQQQLSVAANALKNTPYKLPDELARSIENKLPDAAEKAAAMIASRWTEANTHAQRATAASKDATDHARRNIYGAAAVLIAVFAFALILMGLWIFPNFDELASMRKEKARLHATSTNSRMAADLLTYSPAKTAYDIPACARQSMRLQRFQIKNGA